MVTGVPRIQELLSATKNPKMVNCKIYFKTDNQAVQDLRVVVGHTLTELTLGSVSKSFSICIDKEPESWYDVFDILYSDKEWYADHSRYENCISVKIKIDMLFEYKLTLQEIAEVIMKEYDDLTCVFSPTEIGQIDIFIDTSIINLPEKRLLFIDEENAKEIYLEEAVQPILDKMIIAGIPGIDSIYYTQDGDEWIVETDGSNFKKILAHPDVDMTKIISNNVWEIYDTLGIEAAREFLVKEFMSIMEGINDCHTKLLVERMTFSGTISSISRYTMRTEESGPLGKSSFEEPVDNFLKSAACGEVEPTNGVSASIICGKRAQIGTGMMDLKIDLENLPVVYNMDEEEFKDESDENEREIPDFE